MTGCDIPLGSGDWNYRGTGGSDGTPIIDIKPVIEHTATLEDRFWRIAYSEMSLRPFARSRPAASFARNFAMRPIN